MHVIQRRQEYLQRLQEELEALPQVVEKDPAIVKISSYISEIEHSKTIQKQKLKAIEKSIA